MKNDSFGITGFFVCVLACLFALAVIFNAPAQAKPQPVEPRATFYSYARLSGKCAPIGEGATCEVYVTTRDGLSTRLNTYTARENVRLVAVIDGVGVFETP